MKYLNLTFSRCKINIHYVDLRIDIINIKKQEIIRYFNLSSIREKRHLGLNLIVHALQKNNIIFIPELIFNNIKQIMDVVCFISLRHFLVKHLIFTSLS